MINADIVCISETWMYKDCDHSLYNLSGYCCYFSDRLAMHGGGAMILERNSLRVQPLTKTVSQSDAYNICAVKVIGPRSSLLVASVYRAPWASVHDSCNLFNCLYELCAVTDEHMITGDLNLPATNWSTDNINSASQLDLSLKLFLNEFDLQQINTAPSRLDNVLDVVIVSNKFAQCAVECCSPIAGSDHAMQRLMFTLASLYSSNETTRLDVKKLLRILSTVSWDAAFSGVTDADDYALQFHKILSDAFAQASYVSFRRQRPNLPKHILQLINMKRRVYKSRKLPGNMERFRTLRNAVRKSVRDFLIDQESALLRSGDKRKFFAYVNRRLGRDRVDQNKIYLHDGTLSDSATAEAFSKEFTKNFSSSTSGFSCQSAAIKDIDSNHLHNVLDAFNCDEFTIRKTLRSCRNTAAGPDGYSMKLIKQIINYISRPLLTIYQNSLNQGKFPSIWKRALIVPIYKGKGEKNDPGSYRPISLCSCFGKLLEKNC